MNPILLKLAAIAAEKAERNTNDGPHDEVLSLLKKNNGVVAAHSTGSGKTLLSLKAMQQTGGKSLMITPASLVGNVHKEIKKHGIDVHPDVMSYEEAAKRHKELSAKNYDLTVLDEAHKIRNPDSSRTKAIRNITQHSKNRLLLTATPSYNNPKDLNVLIDTAANKKLLPEKEQEFKNTFYRRRLEVPTLHDMLHGSMPHVEEGYHIPHKAKKIMKEYVHQYDATQSPEAQKHFPSVSEEDVHVPMGHKQKQVYGYYERQLNPVVAWKVKHGLPMEKRDAQKLNAFSGSLRQVSNGLQGFSKHPEKEPPSPKIKEAVSHVEKGFNEDPNFRGVVYSNYLKSGIEPYSRELTKRGIPHHILTGSLPKQKRDEMVKSYNAGEKPVMLISSAGAEGLDLKGTKLVQVMEPHWNDSKLAQVRGRAARYMSHDHLPENERHVTIENYLSTRHGGLTIDEYLHQKADQKKELNEKIMKTIKRPKEREKAAAALGDMGARSLQAPTTGPTKDSMALGLGAAGIAGVGLVGAPVAKTVGSYALTRGGLKAGEDQYLKRGGAFHEGQMGAREFMNGYHGAAMETNVGTQFAGGALAPELMTMRRKMYDMGKKLKESPAGDLSPEHAPLIEALKNKDLEGVKKHFPSADAMKYMTDKTVPALEGLGAEHLGEHLNSLKNNHVVNYLHGLISHDPYQKKERGAIGNLLHSAKWGHRASLLGGLAPAAGALAAGAPPTTLAGNVLESASQVATTHYADKGAGGFDVVKAQKGIKDLYEDGKSGRSRSWQNKLKNSFIGTFGSPVARAGKEVVENLGGVAGGISKIAR